MNTINPTRVEAIFLDSLFRDGEDTTNHVKAEGIINNVGFHPERLKGHTLEIESMLYELPDTFKATGGGGMSFLNACYDRNGNQWTGMHATMEQLILLGVGIGKVKSLMPREMRDVLPGGMPYYVVE